MKNINAYIPRGQHPRAASVGGTGGSVSNMWKGLVTHGSYISSVEEEDAGTVVFLLLAWRGNIHPCKCQAG